MRASLLSLLATVSLAVSAVSSAGQVPASPPSERVFRFRQAFEPATLDWTLGDVPIWVIQNSMRGLFKVDEKGKIVPDLVKSHSTSKNGKTWTFKLKSGISWSDGTPLTAEHAAAALKRLIDPKTGSSYSYFLSGKVANQQKGPSIHAKSALVLEISLTEPVSFLPAILAHWVTYPVRTDLIHRWKDYGNNPKHMAFLGAFQITQWQQEVRIILEPNPKSGMKPYFRKVEVWTVPDDNTAFNLYQSGRLEMLTDPGLAGKSHPELARADSPILYFIGIAPNHPLTTSKEGTLALSAALNRKEIPLALNAPHRPTLAFCPPELWTAVGAPPSEESAIPLEGNPALARKLLQEVLQSKGLKTATGLPAFKLKYFNRPFVAALAEWLQGQWKKNLGLTVELEMMDPKAYWSGLAHDPGILFINSKGASYPDPDAFFNLFSSTSPQNFGHWRDAEYDGWIRGAASFAREKERRDTYVKASRRLLSDHPGLIPLFFRTTEYLIKPYVKDIRINPLTSVDFSHARYDETRH